MSKNNYKITEVGQIPLNWNIVEIQDISEVKTGGTPSKSKPEYWEGDIKWMASGDIHLRKVYDVPQRISKLGFDNSNVKLLPRKTVMIALNGQGKTRGTVAILETELTCNQSLAGFTPSNKFVPEFLYYNLQNRYSEIRNITGDGARNGLNLAILREIKVALPSLQEQQKIATILSSVDEAIERTEAIIEQTDKVKNGLMQQFLTKGIGHTKFKKTEIGEIPEEWDLKTFKEISVVRQGLQIPISERYRESGTDRYVYITIQYLNNPKDSAEYIQSPRSSVICSEDDVLMTRTGNTGQVVTNVYGVFHNNFFLIDYNREIIYKDYLVQFLNFERTQQLIRKLAGTTTIPDLKHGDFYSISVPVPSIHEQRNIAIILKSVEDKVQKEKEKLFKLQLTKKGLMQSLLTGKIRVKVMK
jgi:type I restriction enzyme, S subunit